MLNALTHFATRKAPGNPNPNPNQPRRSTSASSTDDLAPARTSPPFATFLILCPTSFFLGILFSMFPYDYPLLWTASPTDQSYYAFLETHLKHLHSSPPLIPRILHIVIALGLIGFLTKLYKPSESNMLFDGASLVLYMIGVIIYLANIVKGLRTVTSGEYEKEIVEGETRFPSTLGLADDGGALGREDSLKILSASNTILALVLVGVLVLQAGQWYAERKDGQEVARMRREKRERKEAGEERRSGARSPVGGSKGGKKDR